MRTEKDARQQDQRAAQAHLETDRQKECDRRDRSQPQTNLPVTVTPLGAVARLEHAIGNFEGERERYRQRLGDARRRLASYQSRREGEFAFAA